ncbi:MAG: D-alanyl-D-alanine carboxypeptidase/D-alanyl-D-alanine-endopeptidase [Prevotella sp.]|nr:D-alanyl-D-alanine carboxypeptidase/D-alanyl-D-alanine-endopeptidase [Prevotella sp.]
MNSLLHLHWRVIISLTALFLCSTMPAVSQNDTDNIIGIGEEYDDSEDDFVVVDSSFVENSSSWTANIKQRLDLLLENDIFLTTSVGMFIYDLTDNTVLYNYNEKQLMRPASTMKMITAVTALDNLGCDYKLRTQLNYTGSIDNSVLNGNIYIKGDFDPLFDTVDLDMLIDCIKDMGISMINGNVYLDLSMKDNDKLGEGWCWDDDNPTLTPLLLSGKDVFAAKFKNRLADKNIKYGGLMLVGNTPQDAKPIVAVSRKLCDLLPQMMKNSDNLFAEAIFYQLAASATSSGNATAKHGRQMVNKMIRKLGLDTSDYYVADGSGLSLYDYVSPQLEVEFLKYAYNNKVIFDELYKTMPIAGVDGTLYDRMRSGYAHGNVHAKTGTVTRVSALAGYCTAANGHFVCFSIINMGIPKAEIGRKFQDAVCESLCRP